MCRSFCFVDRVYQVSLADKLELEWAWASGRSTGKLHRSCFGMLVGAGASVGCTESWGQGSLGPLWQAGWCYSWRDWAFLGPGYMWGADDDPFDSHLLGKLGEQLVTEVVGHQGLCHFHGPIGLAPGDGHLARPVQNPLGPGHLGR